MNLVPVGKKWIANFLLQLAELLIQAAENKRTDEAGKTFARNQATVLVLLAKRELK